MSAALLSLIFTFSAAAQTNTKSGVSFYTDSTAGAEGITLSSLDVSGYGQIGIEVGSGMRRLAAIGT